MEKALGVRALPFQTELRVDAFPPGLETTLVVPASTTWVLNPPCHFPSRHSSGGGQAALGWRRKASWQWGPLAAPSTCGSYNFIGKMRASIFSPTGVLFFFSWFIFRLLYFGSGSTVFTPCPDKEPFLLRMITTDEAWRKANELAGKVVLND